MKIAVFFVGEVQDDGFNASALAGAERAAQDGLAAITLVSGVRYDQDEIRARAVASSEKATYMLTIVAGIFLPLSFLTGLMGINVGGMPGVEDGDAFWWVTGGCVAIIVVLLAIFKRLKWL